MTSLLNTIIKVKTNSLRDWRRDSSSIGPTWQEWSPEFKPQSHQKIKNKKNLKKKTVEEQNEIWSLSSLLVNQIHAIYFFYAKLFLFEQTAPLATLHKLRWLICILFVYIFVFNL
jgi:hypothetical protein